MRRTAFVLFLAVVTVVGCSPSTPDPSATGTSSASATPAPTAIVTPSADAGTPPAPSATPTPQDDPSEATRSASASPPPEPVRFRGRRVRADIERLAGDIGPREATSPAFRRAARLVRQRFAELGYQVSTERVEVPAGNSWGTQVPAGTSMNVIATLPGFRPRQPHTVIGAHLDTVPVAPGAEDNASGVAMMLELARLVAADPPQRQIRFIAFGAEEPRGTGDDWHHFGSQQLVADLGRAERRAITAMVALDRVGVRNATVPVCSTPRGGDGLRAELRRAGRRAGIPTHGCTDTASDHWSYAKAGVRAVRIGSVPYAGYHSPEDTPSVISPKQLRLGGRLMWSWLRS